MFQTGPSELSSTIASRVCIRPAEPEDDEFLYAVYASTRQEELSLVAWDDEQKTAFLRMQYAAQHAHYHTYYSDADFGVILVGDCPAGRIYVAHRPEEILLIDIALLPEYRNLGIGTSLVEALIEEARQGKKPLRLHVEPFNPALRLYDRLGFVKIADRGFYWFMEWTGTGAAEDSG